MKVIVGCESSQAVTKAFRELGHEAYSCDLLPCDGENPEWHIQDDILLVLKRNRFDLGIFHPPCTYITNSGVSWLHKDIKRWPKLHEGAMFFRACLEANIPRIAVENPIPHKYAMHIIRTPYTQVIQPWMFGHMESKATCLWLKNLPELKPTNDVKQEMLLLPKREQQRLHYLPPGPERWKERSKTFEGIAKAMAEQWSRPVITQAKLFTAA